MSIPEATRRFHFIREIASGGFGSVYLAKVIHADGFSRLAAIKLLHSKWSENEEITKRMRDEARLLGWLRHKHIVDVMDLTIIDGRCAVLMEYLEAVDVKVVINACLEQGVTIPLRVALEICTAVASALDAAFNRPPIPGEKPLRVIHRDIKPSNVMVDEGGMVKVLDFGVARAEFDQREAKTEEMSFGSLEYMPPERLFFEPESASSDVYSLGATLYEMLALDKLGKAKLRQGDQEQFVEQRFDELLEKHPLPGEEIEDILHDLLWDMLSFDEADRPSAGDCVTRMRSFSRRLQDEEGLEEWSERMIPPLVRRMQSAERSPADLALVDRVLTEDTVGFANRIGDEITIPPTDLDAPMVGLEMEPVWVPEPPAPPRPGGSSGDVRPGARSGEVRPPFPADAIIPIAHEATREITPERRPDARKEVRPGARSGDVRPGARSGDVRPAAPAPKVEPLSGPVLPRLFDDAADEGAMTVPLSSAPYVRESALNVELTAFPSIAPTQRQVRAPGPGSAPPPVPDGLKSMMPHSLDPDDEEGEPTVQFMSPIARILDEEALHAMVDPSPDASPARPNGLPPRPKSLPARLDPPAAWDRSDGATGSQDVGAPPRSGAWLILASALTVLVFGVGAIGLVGLLGLGTFTLTRPADPAPALDIPGTPPVVPEPEPVQEVAEGEGARFVSRLEGTRKMLVRCDGGDGDGVDVVVVPGAEPGNCTVTAIDASRGRATTVLNDVEPREYICFEGGEPSCE